MKQLLLLFCFFVAFTATGFSQTALQQYLQEANISFNPPQYLVFSQNEKSVYPNPIDTSKPASKDNPFPTMAQSYGMELASGDTYLNALLWMVTSIVESKKDDYCVLVQTPAINIKKIPRYSLPGINNCSEEEKYILNNMSFDGVKFKFRYGKPFEKATLAESLELMEMVHFYPKEKAKELFNANVLATFPINMRGTAYKGKYNRVKCVTINKEQSFVDLYFMMTDENYRKFDTFLEDFKKVFWFNN